MEYYVPGNLVASIMRLLADKIVRQSILFWEIAELINCEVIWQHEIYLVNFRPVVRVLRTCNGCECLQLSSGVWELL